MTDKVPVPVSSGSFLFAGSDVSQLKVPSTVYIVSSESADRRRITSADLSPVFSELLQRTELTMSFKAGKTMTITGVIDLDPKEFVVNIGHLNVGNGQGDIALHVDLRFDAKGSKNLVVINARQGGCWGEEVHLDSFPFQSGKEFKIIIEFKPDEFALTFNDVASIHFRNRLDEVLYKTIDFEGDATISSFDIKPVC